MHIAVAGDHNGLVLKATLVAHLQRSGHQVLDLGPAELDPNDDYPDFARAVAHAVASGQAERGILVCGSGVGACVAANKVPGTRASVCHDSYSAHQGVEHDDMNVLCLGARIVGEEVAQELVNAFTAARFSGEPRHRRRLEKVRAMEEEAHRARE